jgi:heptosyltransferase II
VPWSKILVRAANWVGDAVMSVPACRALRARYPAARITVLARPWVADVYRLEAFADEVVPYPGTWPEKLRLAAALRRERFDAAILLPNAFEAALVVRLAGIPQRIGYNRDGRGLLLTAAIPPPRKGEIPLHERFYYLELLRRAGVLDTLPAEEPILLSGAAEARAAGAGLFAGRGITRPVVGVSPGAQNSRAKQWLPDRFAESAVQVAGALGGVVVLFGSAAEDALCASIASRIASRGIETVNLAGRTTLAEFIGMAAACRVFLTNDSGAMHVASALGVPTVAVFGPTDWEATAPAGPLACIVREPVDCSPCMLRDCPTDHRCMTRVTADRVAQAALELVK